NQNSATATCARHWVRASRRLMCAISWTSTSRRRVSDQRSAPGGRKTAGYTTPQVSGTAGPSPWNTISGRATPSRIATRCARASHAPSSRWAECRACRAAADRCRRRSAARPPSATRSAPLSAVSRKIGSADTESAPIAAGAVHERPQPSDGPGREPSSFEVEQGGGGGLGGPAEEGADEVRERRAAGLLARDDRPIDVRPPVLGVRDVSLLLERAQEGAHRRIARRVGEAGSELGGRARSEEHTSELQSLAYLVCRLLLEKKKKLKVQKPQITKPKIYQTPATSQQLIYTCQRPHQLLLTQS